MDTELAEILDDMQHDLGKHLALPLRLLPADADAAMVREATHTALWRTRRGPGGDRDAEALWAAFRAELDDHLDAAALAPLTAAIERALRWRARLDGPDPLPRAEVEADLLAVGEAIRALCADGDEVDDG